jgi:hypothetical protein
VPQGVTYKAILSNGSTNARDRLSLPVGAVRRPDGLEVASNVAGLWDGNVGQTINRNEFNQFVGSSFVWTGSLADGRKDETSALGPKFCNNWASTAVSGVAVGQTNSTFTQWLNNSTSSFMSSPSCSEQLRLYCIGPS